MIELKICIWRIISFQGLIFLSGVFKCILSLIVTLHNFLRFFMDNLSLFCYLANKVATFDSILNLSILKKCTNDVTRFTHTFYKSVFQMYIRPFD